VCEQFSDRIKADFIALCRNASDDIVRDDESTTATAKMPKVRLIDANALFLKQKSHADLFKDSETHDEIIRRDEATAALAEIMNAPTIEPEGGTISRERFAEIMGEDETT
jgi:hypothetical protein